MVAATVGPSRITFTMLKPFAFIVLCTAITSSDGFPSGNNRQPALRATVTAAPSRVSRPCARAHARRTSFGGGQADGLWPASLFPSRSTSGWLPDYDRGVHDGHISRAHASFWHFISLDAHEHAQPLLQTNNRLSSNDHDVLPDVVALAHIHYRYYFRANLSYFEPQILHSTSVYRHILLESLRAIWHQLAQYWAMQSAISHPSQTGKARRYSIRHRSKVALDYRQMARQNLLRSIICGATFGLLAVAGYAPLHALGCYFYYQLKPITCVSLLISHSCYFWLNVTYQIALFIINYSVFIVHSASEMKPPVPSAALAALVNWGRLCLSIAPSLLLTAGYLLLLNYQPTRRIFRQKYPITAAFMTAIITDILFIERDDPNGPWWAPRATFFAHVGNQLFPTTATFLFSFVFWSTAFRFLQHPGWILQHPLVFWILFLTSVVPPVAAADDSSTSRPPTFSGDRASWTAWLITFTAYCAWKLTDSLHLLDEPAPPRPVVPPIDPAQANNAELREQATAARAEYDRANSRLYGLIIMALPAWLATSLHMNTRSDGVASMARLRQQFSAVDANDLASAITRVNMSYIDSRADLSENDLRHQFDAMQVANADIVRAGGTAFPDQVLQTMFDNSLPVSYAHIRQFVRRSAHGNFINHFNDYLSLVKAEVDSRAAHAPANAFAAGFIPGPPTAEGGRGAGRGAGKGGGKGKGAGRGGRGGRGRGRGDGTVGRAICFRCKSADHSRLECPQAPSQCPNCSNHADHHPSLCPFGPGCAERDAMSPGAVARIRAEAGSPAAPRQPVAHTATSSTTPQLPAQPTAPVQPPPTPPQPPQPPQPQPPQSQPTGMVAQSGDDDWMRAVRGYPAIVGPLLALPARAGSLTVPSTLRRLCPSASMVELFVDSMASVFILRRAPPGSIVTNGAPGITVQQLSGEAHVQSIVTSTLWLPIEDETEEITWTPLLVRNIHVVPDASADLYATRAIRDAYGASHDLDSRQPSITFSTRPGTVRVEDSGSAFVLRAAFGPPPSPRAIPATPIADQGAQSVHADEPAQAETPPTTPPGAVPTTTEPDPTPPAPMPIIPANSIAPPVAQSLLWHRLGFPHEQAWIHVTSALVNHGQPPNAQLSTRLVASDAVMRGRMRALPFLTRAIADRSLPPPGAVLYMDAAGPIVKSYPHAFTYVSGITDAGSGWGRAYPSHAMTKEVARATYHNFVAELSGLMGLTHQLKPQLVVSDQGSYYLSYYFREFLALEQVQHRTSAVYTPEQNSFIERMWGATFSKARILLASAGLPPTFWPFALQTARWILNRLPSAARGNLSPYSILTRRPADVQYLKAFGCLSAYRLPPARREGDKHLADRAGWGLYLGPSEESPAAVIYTFGNRSLSVTCHYHPYEDRFPGVKGVTFNWLAILGEEGVATPAGTAPSLPNAQTNAPSPQQPQQPPTPRPAPSPTSPAPSPSFVPSPPSRLSFAPSPSMPSVPPAHSPTAPTTHTSRQEGVPPPFRLPQLGDAPTAHPQANDPSSLHFARQHPQRVRTQAKIDNISHTDRRAKSYNDSLSITRAFYVNPLTCDIAAARLNFAMAAVALNNGFDPALTYAVETVADVSSFAHSGVLAMVAAVKSTVEMGEVVIPKSYRQAISGPHASYWSAAITKELEGLEALRTWTVIQSSTVPAGANIMNCHFVFDVKRNQLGEIEKFKARLVADGNTQQHGLDFDRIFSTVVKMSTIRVVMAIAAAEDYNLSSVDVRQAYLHATLTENIYMRVPPSYPRFDRNGQPLVLKLNKSLYGLKQAGREWNKLLVAFLVEWGFTQSVIDVCMFVYTAGKAILWLLVWVDDIILVDNDKALRTRFVAALSDRFPTEDKGELQWIIGVHVTRERTARSLSLSQELYISDLLNRFSALVDNSRRYTSPMDDKLKLSTEHCPEPGSPEHEAMATRRHEYMSIVGAILWLANVTRFELAFAASQLARYVSNPGEIHFEAAVRVLIYLKHSANRVLTFKADASRPLEIYVDSDWSVKFSSSGAMFFFRGCLVHWFAKVQRSVSFSSAESELFGAILASKEGIFLRELLTDLGIPISTATRIYTDSKSVVDLSYDPVSFKKTKHILRAAQGLRDYVARDVITLVHLPGAVNLADILTKAQAVAVFVQLMAAYDAFLSQRARAETDAA